MIPLVHVQVPIWNLNLSNTIIKYNCALISKTLFLKTDYNNYTLKAYSTCIYNEYDNPIFTHLNKYILTLGCGNGPVKLVNDGNPGNGNCDWNNKWNHLLNIHTMKLNPVKLREH